MQAVMFSVGFSTLVFFVVYTATSRFFRLLNEVKLELYDTKQDLNEEKMKNAELEIELIKVRTEYYTKRGGAE